MSPAKRLYRRWKIAYFRVTLLAIALAGLCIPSWRTFAHTGDNSFTIYVDGIEVGVLDSVDDLDDLFLAARREVASSSDELVLTGGEVTYTGEEVLWGTYDDEETVVENMAAVLEDNVRETLHRSYTVKINEYTANLASKEEVLTLLYASLSKYDTEGEYDVSLTLDPDRELTVLTTSLAKTEESTEVDDLSSYTLPSAGIEADLDEIFATAEPAVEKDFDDYELGLQDISFGETVEVVEAYLEEGTLTDLQTAIDEVTKDQEKEQIYEVVSGDTLSQIAMNNNLSLDELIALNDSIEDETATIRIGDELIITVPEPELSVEYTEQLYYEEDYEADIIYVDNDDWYTTQTKTLQEPSAGHHIVVANVTYRNNEEISREILKEEVTYEPTPKIVERGTKIPPTYIKPISGGRISSTFGYRTAPTKGASTYHKGVDWSTPVGTAVMASSAGTVTKAGWSSGYGYVIYIKHADGRETRYGHLSKILVSVGQTVSQGQKIALSGNSGVSTGPHLHFEILINGSQVNPLNYLS